jgi:uncharacterized membrane protein
MESLFFHPKVVHIPMALAVLMPLIAGFMLLAWWRNWFSQKVWLLAVAMQAILVVSAFVALRTGEAEEHKVEKVVPHDAIEHHEHAAQRFFLASAGSLVLMAAAAALQKKRVGLPLAAASVLATGVVLALGISAGHDGGNLVYQHNAGAAYGDRL